MSESGRRQFHLDVIAGLNAATAANAGRFVALIVLGDNPEDDSEFLAQLRCNVEHPAQFLLHIRDMIDEMLREVPTTDLRDVKGNA